MIAKPADRQGEPFFKSGQTILFQGDSITDCGRDRNDPRSLGSGYVSLIASWFTAAHPDRKVTFLNRGVSGDRVKDLQKRWVNDCLALKPDWLTVFVGINDVWRKYDANDPTSRESFTERYRDLLGMAKSAGMRLILMDPFVVPVPEDRRKWREDLDPKIKAVQSLAGEFEAIHIPLDRIFFDACTHWPPADWAGDGVHPSAAGHALIARSWLQAVGGL